VLSNKKEYWGGAHRDLLGSILSQGGRLWREWELKPVHWAGLLGGKCSVADFKEVAADHGHDLESSSEDLVVSPAHYAARLLEPNLKCSRP
jgi:hypothetical protein